MTKLLKKVALVGATASAFLGATATVASAQLAPPATQGFGDMLGTSTAGSESGIYEYMPMLQTAAGVIIGVTLIFVGVQIVKKVVRKAS